MTHYRKKIAVVIPRYGLVGGAENFVSELSSRIALNPLFDVHVFANKWLSNSSQITFHKIPIIIFPKFLTTISFAHFAKKGIGNIKFDIVHTHDRIFEADIFTMHGTPHRFWIHEVRKKQMSLFDYSTEWVEKNLVQGTRCKKFISVSNLAKEKFVQSYDIEAEKVQVIHPGIDMNRFKNLDKEMCRREVRSQWGINLHDSVILFVSMNFDIKGLDMVIAAVAKIKIKLPSSKIKLLVVGKGEEKKYKTMAKDCGIGNEVIFTGVQREKMDQIYLACDMFSILSKFDTFGITVLEAMAASLPVIVSGNVGAKDLIKQGINGFIIEERTDIDAVSEKIVILLNRDIRVKMGQQAYQTALTNSWDFVSQKYESIYNEVLNDRISLNTTRKWR